MSLKKVMGIFKANSEMTDAETENWILSYPKSGRTWLRVILGQIFAKHYNIGDVEFFNEKTMALAAGLPPVDFSHDETSNSEGRNLNDLTSDKSSYQDKNILLLVRDPRDVVVSCFFQATRRKSRYTGDMAEFIRSETHGIKKIIRYYQIWEQNQTAPKSFTLLRYEDMHHHSFESIQTTLGFLGAKGIPDNIIHEGIEFGSFESMRKMEEKNTLKNKKLRPGDKNDPESYKVRKGKIGNYTEYMSEDDIAYCSEALTNMQSPFGYRAT